MVVGMIMIALAQAMYADPEALHRIDQTFVCPEALNTVEAKMDALAKFDADMARAVKHITLEQLGEARMLMLRRHHCTVTLLNLRRNGVR